MYYLQTSRQAYRVEYCLYWCVVYLIRWLVYTEWHIALGYTAQTDYCLITLIRLVTFWLITTDCLMTRWLGLSSTPFTLSANLSRVHRSKMDMSQFVKILARHQYASKQVDNRQNYISGPNKYCVFELWGENCVYLNGDNLFSLRQ